MCLFIYICTKSTSEWTQDAAEMGSSDIFGKGWPKLYSIKASTYRTIKAS